LTTLALARIRSAGSSPLATEIRRLFINLTPFRFLFGNPIPFIPFPLIRGRGNSYIREASPLFDSPSKEGKGLLVKGFRPFKLPLIND